MGDIIDFTGNRRDDADPDTTLLRLLGQLEGFVLVGYDKDGNELTAVTFGHLPEALWILERGKKSILERVDAEY
jgi:hypothetical protein